MKVYLYYLANVLLVVACIKAFTFGLKQPKQNPSTIKEGGILGFKQAIEMFMSVREWFAAAFFLAFISGIL